MYATSIYFWLKVVPTEGFLGPKYSLFWYKDPQDKSLDPIPRCFRALAAMTRASSSLSAATRRKTSGVPEEV